MDDLQTRPLRQTLLFLRNNSLAVEKLQTDSLTYLFSGECILFDHAKNSATNALKTISKKVIQKTAEATNDLIGNKTADTVTKLFDYKITKISRTRPQNSSGTVTNETENNGFDRKIPKSINISPEKRQKTY